MSQKINLPDFEDIANLADEIGELTRIKLNLELNIKLGETKVVLEAQKNPNYFQNGKIPSMDFIKNSYMVTGFDGNLVPLRAELANIVGSLEKAKLRFQMYQDLIGLYRTESANQRKAVS